MALQQSITTKLHDLDAGEHQTPNLQLLISSIHGLVPQNWTTLRINYRPDCAILGQGKYWGSIDGSKWTIISWFTDLAVSYNKACEEAAENGVELDTRSVDERILSLMADISEKGAEEREVIEINEWQREGTLALLCCEGVVASDE